jgi:hypothetical protein
VYGWDQQCKDVETITQIGMPYTFFSLKTQPNSGFDLEGTNMDRGGDFPYRMLYDETSRFKFGKLDGKYGGARERINRLEDEGGGKT